MTRFLIFLLLFCTIPFISYSEPNCSFNVPPTWDKKMTQWDGECKSGRADGLGVLKEYKNKKAVRIFLGQMKLGNVEFGVIDQNDGYIAGHFENGTVKASDDRQIYLDAFREGEKAASEAAKRFEKSGNKKSAKFYLDKAKDLRDQMD